MPWPWHQQGRHATIAPSDCTSAVDRILASQAFARSDRHRRFLSFVVAESLAGRASSVKETVIAAEVYERPDSFDPQVDSLVRVEARKLRKRLDDYYAGEGAADPVRIDIPKGSYVPVFTARRQDGPRHLSLLVAAGLAAIVLVAGGSVAWKRYARPLAASIAILPFETPGGDPALAAFGDGLAGEVAFSLTQVPALRVAPREAVRTVGEARDLARRLGVDSVLNGRVTRSGDHLHITVFLRSADDRLIWSGDWDRDAPLTATLYRDIAVGVSTALGRGTPGSAVAAPSIAARDLYWTARYLRERRVIADIERSVPLYRQLVAANPAYAAAWAGLSEACTDLVFHRRAEHASLLPLARDAAARAIALDKAQAGAHVSLGRIHYFLDWDWPAAEADFQRALAADPSSASTHREFSLALAGRRRFDEALLHAQRAAELDPLSSVANYDSALILFMAGHYPECLESTRRGLAVNPSNHALQALAGTCNSSAGRPGEALPHYQRALTLAPERAFILGRLGAAQALAGDAAAARQTLSRLDEKTSPGFSWVHPAYIHAALGNRAAALDCLRRAADSRDSDFVFIGAEPLFAGLTGEPRFRALLSDLKLQ